MTSLARPLSCYAKAVSFLWKRGVLSSGNACASIVERLIVRPERTLIA